MNETKKRHSVGEDGCQNGESLRASHGESVGGTLMGDSEQNIEENIHEDKD